MAIGSAVGSATLIILGSAFALVLVFAGIGVAVILSIIPSYLTTRNITPLGEEYCINNLYLNATFNSTSPYGNFSNLIVNTSYELSTACYRILENYEPDSLLSACLLSNCSLASNVNSTNSLVSANVLCSAVIYYSSRCSDESPNKGINNTINATTNSACRTRRISNINGALGSSSVQYTNVVGLTIGGVLVPLKSIYGIIFSNSSQVGAFYCGTVTRTAISSAVTAQSTG